MIIDPQALMRQHRGGISRYFVELLKNADEFLQQGVDLSAPYKWVINSHAADDLPNHFSLAPRRGHRASATLANLGLVRSYFTRGEAVHHTLYDPRFLKASQGKKRISTIYDMIPEKFPQYFLAGNPHESKKTFAEESDALIAISQQTKNDIVDVYGIPEERITVVPLGVSDRFSSSVVSSAQKDQRPYILFVGNRGGYKNFELLIEALGRLGHLASELDLVVAGGGALTSHELQKIEKTAWRVIKQNPDESELASLYRSATLFCFPSQYEGFGLPVLEAMASGCPTVLAQAGSLPEVGGTAAQYFNALDSEELAETLLRVVFDEDLRAQLIVDGQARASQFSWRQTATQTASVYSAVE